MKTKKEGFKIKFFDIIKQPRVLLLLFFILLSFVAINYQFSAKGVVINGVSPSGAAELAGMSFDSNQKLSEFERIISIDGVLVETVPNFYSVLSEKSSDGKITILTNKGSYTLELQENSSEPLSSQIGFSVREAPKSNIRLGIELEGGSRLILKTKTKLSESDFDLLVNTLQSRLDVFGASGTKVNKLEDPFSNDQFIIVESISSNKNDIFELIKRQGEFEAYIGDDLVFTGDNVLRVFNDPAHARLESCTGTDQIICSFAFQVEIDSEGANSFFEKTQSLNVIGSHLSEKVRFVLDGKNITELSIASSFKYQKISLPQITVSGNPMPTRQKAIDSAQKEMKFLQTILSTQSLPTELEVVQSYSISSSLGEQLLENAIVVGIFALLLVASVVALRYREIGVFIGILIALVAEVIIVFGVSAFMRISIDLAAIGGIIAAIGTGVDDQIIITDEYFRKFKKTVKSKLRIKHAFIIIMIAYLTTLAAMVPLYFAGLKVLKGFAFMIIVGVTIGVFITRPAYAAILRVLKTTREQRKEEDEEE
jgi:preprotein translocase subunit SecD